MERILTLGISLLIASVSNCAAEEGRVKRNQDRACAFGGAAEHRKGSKMVESG